MQKFATPQPIFRFLAPAFIFYAAVMAEYNRRYLKILGKYNIWTLVRSVMLLAAAFGVFLVIPSENFRGLFLIITVGVITVAEIILGYSAENLLLNETLLIAFGLFFYFFGAYFYIPSFQILYLLGTFLSTSDGPHCLQIDYTSINALRDYFVDYYCHCFFVDSL